MTVWQSMDTAPKDKPILVFDRYQREDEHAVFVVRWLGSEKHGIKDGWYSVPAGYHKRPTHWTPLPAPPS